MKTLQCSPKLQKQAQALGIDWSKIATIENLVKLIQLLEQIFGQQTVQGKKAAAAGCCDHSACCQKVICLQFQALRAAIEHAAQCDDGSEPEPSPDAA